MTSKIVTTIQNPGFMVRISNGKCKMVAILVSFQMIGVPDFRSHLKSRPLVNQPPLGHSKSGCVPILDPRSIN